MVNKIAIKCKNCNLQLGIIFLYERKQLQLGYLPRIDMHCGRCGQYNTEKHIGERNFFDSKMCKEIQE